MLGYLIAACVIIVLALVGYELLRRGSGKRRVCIVVLGDIGRSPRMQYHALSLAKEGWQVDLVGYGGMTTRLNFHRGDNKVVFSPQYYEL